MNVIREIGTDIASRVGITETPEGLVELRKPKIGGVIWQRNPTSQFQSWINTLDPKQLPKTRVVLRPHAARDAMHKVCEVSGTPDCSERNVLVDDVAAMADVFANLMGANWLRLRLDAVTTNACRRFHIDAVTARLVCTYRGTGTQYGILGDADEPDHIFTAPTGAPILLRGTLWPDQSKSRLVHRSPPIEGTGEARLLLVLDPVDEPENEPDHQYLH
ncbi:DUF1826 domain-containing protein [Falsiruegeria mediterranea]|uniref:DUF1826 domain-containing protein n=1 Tax=Falsiruegeria mediterranea M17 TaxID=1200281 RepID=A0A2R8C454_9RHOB|nr:DUF1826 domain-containing protein [Falsiruegeria mediterranea]SPJ27113.1 hypothetical protein TRM7615_00594 [Falsiruegeria mediterranea M17]